MFSLQSTSTIYSLSLRPVFVGRNKEKGYLLWVGKEAMGVWPSVVGWWCTAAGEHVGVRNECRSVVRRSLDVQHLHGQPHAM